MSSFPGPIERSVVKAQEELSHAETMLFKWDSGRPNVSNYEDRMKCVEHVHAAEKHLRHAISSLHILHEDTAMIAKAR